MHISWSRHGKSFVLGTLLCLAWAPPAFTQNIPNFTQQVSSSGQTNATEPSVAVDRSDGTVYVAWQGSGTHVARSDDGGRTFVETPINNLFGPDVGDVDVR
ncbi:MAG TPA: hypothetical protein VJK29_22025, partial [Terriglobales bacterium]|nr:hypothetical protein [Terriglobales bacterium]